MHHRIIASTILALLILPIALIGPQQYGYAFLGYLSCLGTFAKAFGTESSIWILILPLMTIITMILFCALSVAAIVCLAMAITGRPQTTLGYKATGYMPLAFSFCIILGLTFFALLPSQPPIKTPIVLFVAPFLLLLASGYYAFIAK